jgi:putative (di)nucleoside polyphosphate hydrolase
VLGATTGWLRYDIPRQFLRRDRHPVCIGQKQRWFLLRLLSDDSAIRIDAHSKPEFDRWRWVEYWEPAREVVFFKRFVYRRALAELAPILGVEARPKNERPPSRRRTGPRWPRASRSS